MPMLHKLELEKYRSFDEYELTNLARVNLLVGRNDCGKTSILEAVQLLTSQSDPEVLIECAERRGEGPGAGTEKAGRSGGEEASRPAVSGASMTRFFFGNQPAPKDTFRISGDGEREITVGIELHEESKTGNDELDGPAFDLVIRSSSANQTVRIAMTESGCMLNHRQARFRGPWENRNAPRPRVQFLTLESLVGEELRQAWDTALKEGREHEAIEALKVLDQDMNSIAVLTSPTSRGGSGRAGVLLGSGNGGLRERVPLGTHGDGMHRLLALSLALVQAGNGVLLIDGIDTGLHWTALENVWRLVIETAKQRSMQVFATTHSHDCIRALSWLVESTPELGEEIGVQKIGRKGRKAVHLDRDEIRVAIEQNIEIR